KHNDRILLERNKWLERFRSTGIFSEEAIRDALEEPLDAYRHPAPQLVPHLSYKLKKNGAPSYQTYIDLNTQLKVEKLVADYIRPLRYQRIQQAAVIVIDTKTGQVISYLGSADFRDPTDGGQVNGAAAVRQPGSTLKPLVYGLAIDACILTPKTILTDVATNYEGYAPENFDRQFNGPVSMEYALDHSLNIPAVKTLAKLGKDQLITSLSGIGFEQVRKDKKKLGLSMVLGGCGTSLEELTGLFSSFARQGIYRPPLYYQADSSTVSKTVLSPAASFMINQVLSKVNRPDFPLSWQSTEKLPKIAWKTGTSYGRRDAWSIGYNQRYTIGVWVGNFSGEGAASLSGAETATPLLFRLFNSIDYNPEQDWFSQPASCAIRKVCATSGLPPGDYCESLLTDYFIPLVSTGQTCEHSREIAVRADGKYTYCMQCLPAAGYKKERFPLLDPTLLRWMDERKISYKKIPAHNPDCEQVFREGAPAILSPRHGTDYLMERTHPEPLLLQCQAAPDVLRVHWYINDRYYKSAGAKERVFFQPEPGPVKISCTDDKGRNRDITIQVQYFGQ
ncbi:penicillin-binding transpeptidase domain-containing protein, partial [Flavihumibacter sp. CACIAM 22H1]|uniref:penicillin-binding protein 1C n=1 Tax=Flavihumibacter sp. CACIAM 22H1 TaxID=1812911 RepID=UPI0007A8D1DB